MRNVLCAAISGQQEQTIYLVEHIALFVEKEKLDKAV